MNFILDTRKKEKKFLESGTFRDKLLESLEKRIGEKRDLAKELEMSYTTLCSYFNGNTKLPAQLLIELSILYDFSIDEVINEVLEIEDTKAYERKTLLEKIQQQNKDIDGLNTEGLRLLQQLFNSIQTDSRYKAVD